MNDSAMNPAPSAAECASGACCPHDIRKATEDRVIQMEWEFFQNVNNVGGRASCQDMPQTFEIMRRSQFAIWTDEMLISYYGDLRSAQIDERNPMTEKYGYMMESTHPGEFALIKDALPAISAKKRELIDQIVAIQIAWAEAVSAAYPRFAGRGRVIRSSQDSASATSIETYSRGELATYSEHTLELMLEHFARAQADGRNLQEDVDACIARSYGYRSLADAEAAMA